MNEFITTENGRMPFVLDDIRFLDSIYRGAIEAIAKGLNNGADFIITGIGVAVVTGTSYAATGGVIYFNGEILVVPDASLVIPEGSKAVIEKAEGFDPKGSKMYSDGILRNTYHLVGGKFIVVDESTEGYFEINSSKISEIYKLNFTENSAFNKAFGSGIGEVEKGSNNPSQIITEVIEVGSWDMETTSSKSIDLRGIDILKIINITIVIIKDLEDELKFATLGGDISNVYIFDGAVSITRDSLGIFNSDLYSNTGINRGYIKIEYLP